MPKPVIALDRDDEQYPIQSALRLLPEDLLQSLATSWFTVKERATAKPFDEIDYLFALVDFVYQYHKAEVVVRNEQSLELEELLNYLYEHSQADSALSTEQATRIHQFTEAYSSYCAKKQNERHLPLFDEADKHDSGFGSHILGIIFGFNNTILQTLITKNNLSNDTVERDCETLFLPTVCAEILLRLNISEICKGINSDTDGGFDKKILAILEAWHNKMRDLSYEKDDIRKTALLLHLELYSDRNTLFNKIYYPILSLANPSSHEQTVIDNIHRLMTTQPELPPFEALLDFYQVAKANKGDSPALAEVIQRIDNRSEITQALLSEDDVAIWLANNFAAEKPFTLFKTSKDLTAGNLQDVAKLSHLLKFTQGKVLFDAVYPLLTIESPNSSDQNIADEIHRLLANQALANIIKLRKIYEFIVSQTANNELSKPAQEFIKAISKQSESTHKTLLDSDQYSNITRFFPDNIPLDQDHKRLLKARLFKHLERFSNEEALAFYPLKDILQIASPTEQDKKVIGKIHALLNDRESSGLAKLFDIYHYIRTETVVDELSLPCHNLLCEVDKNSVQRKALLFEIDDIKAIAAEQLAHGESNDLTDEKREACFLMHLYQWCSMDVLWSKLLLPIVSLSEPSEEDQKVISKINDLINADKNSSQVLLDLYNYIKRNINFKQSAAEVQNIISVTECDCDQTREILTDIDRTQARLQIVLSGNKAADIEYFGNDLHEQHYLKHFLFPLLRNLIRYVIEHSKMLKIPDERTKPFTGLFLKVKEAIADRDKHPIERSYELYQYITDSNRLPIFMKYNTLREHVFELIEQNLLGPNQKTQQNVYRQHPEAILKSPAYHAIKQQTYTKFERSDEFITRNRDVAITTETEKRLQALSDDESWNIIKLLGAYLSYIFGTNPLRNLRQRTNDFFLKLIPRSDYPIWKPGHYLDVAEAELETEINKADWQPRLPGVAAAAA